MKSKIPGWSIILLAAACLCIAITATASAQSEVTIESATPLPDRAGLNARYEVAFTTSASGSLTAGLDAIRITFPDEVHMPSSIEANEVFVNGTSCYDGGAVFIDDHTVVITPADDVAADTTCTVIIGQQAGITNPRLSQETGDNAPDELYVLTVATDKDAADTIEYEVFDWVGASPTELAHHDPCTVWGAGFKPGSTIHLNGLEGGPVEGSGLVGEDGTFQFTGSATGKVDLPLIATDGSGRSAEFEGNAPELPPTEPPAAKFSYTPSNPDEYPEENPVTGEAVIFDASASSDPDGEVVAWDWDFGDGNEGSGKTVTHSYSEAGEYLVWLTVTDNRGATGTSSKTLVIAEHVEEINAPPIADAGPDQIVEITGDEEAEIILDASGSYDTDDDPLTYSWVWESGSASGVNPSVLLAPGTNTIMLTVSDGKLASTDETLITVKQKSTEEKTPTPTGDMPVEPTVSFEITPKNPVAGEEITFDGSVSNDPSRLLTSYDWSFGDGENASGEIATHTYEQPGLYTVSLFSRDDDGNVYSYTTNISIVEETASGQTPAITPTVDEDKSGDGGSSNIIWIVIVIVIVIAAGTGFAIWRLRARREQPGEE